MHDNCEIEVFYKALPTPKTLLIWKLVSGESPHVDVIASYLISVLTLLMISMSCLVVVFYVMSIIIASLTTPMVYPVIQISFLLIMCVL